MVKLKWVRIGLWIAVAVVVLGAIFYQPNFQPVEDKGAPDIGGAFSMTDHTGRAVGMIILAGD